MQNNGPRNHRRLLLRQRFIRLRQKSLALVFFDSQGIIYTDHIPKGTMVDTTYIRIGLYRVVD
jgi:hypothetical protein